MRRDQKGVTAVAEPRAPSAHQSSSWFWHQERKPRSKLIRNPEDARLAKSKTQVYSDEASNLGKRSYWHRLLDLVFGYDFLSPIHGATAPSTPLLSLVGWRKNTSRSFWIGPIMPRGTIGRRLAVGR
jgi:hypothetical protein